MVPDVLALAHGGALPPVLLRHQDSGAEVSIRYLHLYLSIYLPIYIYIYLLSIYLSAGSCVTGSRTTSSGW